MTAPVLAILAASALLSAGLVMLLRPLLVRYALARPNARSSHTIPTPQGGGIAVIAAALGVTAAVLFLRGGWSAEMAWVGAGTIAVAILGAVDDLRPLSAGSRLAVQAAAVAAIVVAAGGNLRLLPDIIPLPVERALAILAGLWFVNLVNFMDGLDWMTVAGMAPAIAIAGFLLLWLGVEPATALAAFALCGALLGFAPFNRPVAKLFLGDVGSLPIGLLVAWILYKLALAGGLAAAILLPLYHLADATLTLLRRLRRGEKVWQAHRSHFYQRATDHGFTVPAIVGRVFALNLVLGGLASATILWPFWPVEAAALGLGAALVGIVLARFSAPRAAEGRT